MGKYIKLIDEETEIKDGDNIVDDKIAKLVKKRSPIEKGKTNTTINTTPTHFNYQIKYKIDSDKFEYEIKYKI